MFFRSLLFPIDGSNHVNDTSDEPGVLSPDAIFPTAINETEIIGDDMNCLEAEDSSNLLSRQCSTVSDSLIETLGNNVGVSPNGITTPNATRHPPQPLQSLPPQISPAQGFNGFYHGQPLPPPQPPMGAVVFPSSPYYPQYTAAYQGPLPTFSPNYFDGNKIPVVPLRTTQKMQDLLRVQRALYLDSLGDKGSSNDEDASATSSSFMSDAHSTATIPTTARLLECSTEPPILYVPVADTPNVAEAKKKPTGQRRRGCPRSPKSIRKLQLGRQRLRPMSAFNIFFKEERARIVGTAPPPLSPGDDHPDNDSSSSSLVSTTTTQDASSASSSAATAAAALPTTPEDHRNRRKRPHNVIGFSELGKLIGQRWRQLSREERAVYQEKARQDKARYEAEKAAAEAAARATADRNSGTTGQP